MKKFTFKSLIISIIISLTCLCKCNVALAADNQPIKLDKQPVITTTSTKSDKNIIMPPKQDVDIEKKWVIKFNQPIDEKSISKNIKVIDKKSGQEVPITLKLGQSKNSIEVYSNSPYNPDSEYSIIIDTTLKSTYNKQLSHKTTMDFKTGSIITDIPNVELDIEQEAKISLPKKVTAKMSNGTTKEVDVKWSNPPTNSHIPKTYICSGTLDNSKYKYKNEISLKVNIKPFVPVSHIGNNSRNQSKVQTNLFNYLMDNDHRESTLKRAVELHNGITKNNCVFFASEALRRAGLTKLPNSVCNTLGLTNKLKSYGWKVSTDLSKMLPGDICFTKSYGWGPTHTYIFMNWVNSSSYDYAYICDNQGHEPQYGNIYHKRNINFSTVKKDEISYFMYLP